MRSVPKSTCAILAGEEREMLAAVRRQTHPPAEIIVAAPPGATPSDAPPAAGLRTLRVDPAAGVAGAADAGVRAAMATDAAWLWLLDGSAVPADDALERLLAVLDDLGRLPTPALLAGAVVGSDGEPHPAALPFNRLTRKDVTIEACRHRLVAIRAARHGSLLVARAAVARDGPPRADFVSGDDDIEWTARLLREGHGYLVPDSTAMRRDSPAPAGAPPAAPSVRGVRNDVVMLRGPAWAGEERLWMGYLVAAGIARGLRAHPAAAAGAIRGLASGLRSRA